MTTALAVAGVVVAFVARSESPAPAAQLPLTPLPAAVAPPPATSPSDDSSPSISPVPPPASKSAGVGGPPASRRSSTPVTRTEPAHPAPFQASYEAESQRNVMGGQARPMPRDDASDGLVVRFVGKNEANFLRFTGLTVPDSDIYSVQVHYISGEARQATMLVNGRSLGDLTFPASPDWYTVDALTLRIPLNAGANTIEVRNDIDYAPDFDRIDLTR
ncbi:hypothetical protein [Actinoplanes sp. NPDC049118]|uniref:hypothetical protein n=1 Tax=Actinoplanes sp. NPDC049118 TaxID=3155769 RepID=UPI0033C49088